MNNADSNANGGGQVAVAFAQNQRDEVREMKVAGALASDPGMKQQTYVFEPRFARNGRGAPDTVAPPLKAQSGKTGKGDSAPAVFGPMAVRRLTPLECERLQGFPDGYTKVPGASDSGRYRALGNSMAVPVMRWIGQRIEDFNGR
jgi:DNA (cytosine-5)-methyltransferase 1